MTSFDPKLVKCLTRKLKFKFLLVQVLVSKKFLIDKFSSESDEKAEIDFFFSIFFRGDAAAMKFINIINNLVNKVIYSPNTEPHVFPKNDELT